MRHYYPETLKLPKATNTKVVSLCWLFFGRLRKHSLKHYLSHENGMQTTVQKIFRLCGNIFARQHIIYLFTDPSTGELQRKHVPNLARAESVSEKALTFCNKKHQVHPTYICILQRTTLSAQTFTRMAA